MTDVFSSEKRSQIMARIGSADTKPELMVRRALHSLGFRYRLHRRDLPGRPDIVLPKYRAVIFVHGCFWHRHPGCRLAYEPKSRTIYWKKKFTDNVRRDRKVTGALLDQGWRVAIFWECSTRRKDRFVEEIRRLSEWISSSEAPLLFETKPLLK